MTIVGGVLSADWEEGYLVSFIYFFMVWFQINTHDLRNYINNYAINFHSAESAYDKTTVTTRRLIDSLCANSSPL